LVVRKIIHLSFGGTRLRKGWEPLLYSTCKVKTVACLGSIRHLQL
jgi:hypothetical protein